ncbi:MAG: terpene cyclase/mutase family protein [Planctomycetota bacterium]|nr:terpene cyclase/mutase family protein [Planctomycetota bacterium]
MFRRLSFALIVLTFGFCSLVPFVACGEQGESPAEAKTDADKPGEKEQPSAQSVLETTFARGMKWLTTRQLMDGSWPDPQGKADVAFTAMAVKAIAEAPESVKKEYSANMEKGVKYILGCIQDGGKIVDAGKIPTLANYKTGLSLMALVAVDREKYAEQILKARRYLEQTQFCESYMDVKPDSKAYGGWGYDEKTQTANPDLSNSSMTIAALKSAGLPEDSEVWKRAVKFLERVQNRSESNDVPPAIREQDVVPLNDGGFYYRPDESKGGPVTRPDGKKAYKSYGSMTYLGLMSFIYSFVKKDDPRVAGAYDWIRDNFTFEENPGLRTDADPNLGKQGLFYYYHTFAKALDAYGEAEIVTIDNVKHRWADELVAYLAEVQQKDGSWSNTASRWWEDDPGLCTSYVLMTLNIARKWAK